MGSLVPGWDANLGVPRDLVPDSEDIGEDPEPQGYFARLRSHRHSHGGSGEGSSSPSIARVSAPLSLGRSATLQPKHTSQAMRSSSMAHDGLQAPSHGSQQQKYHFTDWSEELSTLRKAGISRGSQGGHGEAHGQQGQEGGAWWRALEVGQLNEHPDAEPNHIHDVQHSTFVPQFTQSQKLNYGDAAE